MGNTTQIWVSPGQGQRGASREVMNQERFGKDPKGFSPAQRDGIMEYPELDPTEIIQCKPWLCTDAPTMPPCAQALSKQDNGRFGNVR